MILIHVFRHADRDMTDDIFFWRLVEAHGFLPMNNEQSPVRDTVSPRWLWLKMIYSNIGWFNTEKRPISVSPVCPWTGLDVQFWTCLILVLLIQLGHSGCSGCMMLDVHALLDSRCSISLRFRFWVAFIRFHMDSMDSAPGISKVEQLATSSTPADPVPYPACTVKGSDPECLGPNSEGVNPNILGVQSVTQTSQTKAIDQTKSTK